MYETAMGGAHCGPRGAVSAWVYVGVARDVRPARLAWWQNRSAGKPGGKFWLTQRGYDNIQGTTSKRC